MLKMPVWEMFFELDIKTRRNNYTSANGEIFSVFNTETWNLPKKSKKYWRSQNSIFTRKLRTEVPAVQAKDQRSVLAVNNFKFDRSRGI